MSLCFTEVKSLYCLGLTESETMIYEISPANGLEAAGGVTEGLELFRWPKAHLTLLSPRPCFDSMRATFRVCWHQSTQTSLHWCSLETTWVGYSLPWLLYCLVFVCLTQLELP